MRHEFQPGRFLLGLTFLAIALAYGGRQDGVWDGPWWLGFPVLGVGLFLAIAGAVVGQLVRGAAKRRRKQRETAGAGGTPGIPGEGPEPADATEPSTPGQPPR